MKCVDCEFYNDKTGVCGKTGNAVANPSLNEKCEYIGEDHCQQNENEKEQNK